MQIFGIAHHHDFVCIDSVANLAILSLDLESF